MEVDRLVASGMSEHEARFTARRVFGNTTAACEQFHESRAGFGLESIGQDVRYALRGMRRNPTFTTIAIASLAIGIGANTAIFGVLDTMLLRTPAHVCDAGRINRVYFEVPSPGATRVLSTLSYSTYLTLRDRARGLDAVAAFWSTKVSSGRGIEARSIDAVAVTPSFFNMLGVRPALGRFFAADEERDDGNHVAILG